MLIFEAILDPHMKLYDGTTYVEEHVAHYYKRMEIITIPHDLKEACLCREFGSTLSRAALKWLLSVPTFSIYILSYLVNLYNNQFSFSGSFERLTGIYTG